MGRMSESQGRVGAQKKRLSAFAERRRSNSGILYRIRGCRKKRSNTGAFF
jgi:hypothetical protein